MWGRMYTYGHDNNADPMNDSYRGSDCLNFTTGTATAVVHIKGLLGALTIIANLFAIVVIVYSKKCKPDFTFRLVIYLMATDVLQAVAIILEVLPIVVPNDISPAQIRSGRGWINFCAASGFIGMVTLWMGNIIIVWIVLYLLIVGRRLNQRELENTNNQVKSSWKLEVFGVVFLFVAPFVIGIIPFPVDHDMYGISGLWCWIKVIDNYCGDLKSIPLIVVLTLFYVPLVIIVVLAVIFMMTTIVLVHYGAKRRHSRMGGSQQRHVKEIKKVLLYPALYCTVCLLLLANRVYSIAHPDRTPNKGLWITHAVADPIRVMLPAIAFLLPHIWKNLCSCKPQASDRPLLSTNEQGDGDGNC